MVTLETKDLVRAGTREVKPRVIHLIVPTEMVPAPVLETAYIKWDFDFLSTPQITDELAKISRGPVLELTGATRSTSGPKIPTY